MLLNAFLKLKKKQIAHSMYRENIAFFSLNLVVSRFRNFHANSLFVSSSNYRVAVKKHQPDHGSDRVAQLRLNKAQLRIAQKMVAK